MRRFLLLILALGCRYDLGAVPRPGAAMPEAGDEKPGEPAPAEPGDAGSGVEGGGVEIVGPEVMGSEAMDSGSEAVIDLAPEKLLGNGTACKAGSECASGHCVEGVCCDSACSSAMEKACFSCKVAGKVGQCAGKCVCYSSCGTWSCTAC